MRQNAFLPQDVGWKLRGLLAPAGCACSCVPAGAQQGYSVSGAPSKHITLVRPPGSKPILASHSLSKCLTSFQVSCYKGKCKQSVFRRCSVAQPSICMFSQTLLSCLIYFILKGLSICITRTGGEKVSDVCQVGFLLLLVIVKNDGLLFDRALDSPSTAFSVPICLLCRCLHIRGGNSTY